MFIHGYESLNYDFRIPFIEIEKAVKPAIFLLKLLILVITAIKTGNLQETQNQVRILLCRVFPSNVLPMLQRISKKHKTMSAFLFIESFLCSRLCVAFLIGWKSSDFVIGWGALGNSIRCTIVCWFTQSHRSVVQRPQFCII